MLTPLMHNKPDLEHITWAGDNGCFAQPQSFRLDAYLDWLDARPRATCLFATAPDVLADAAATWERSRSVLPQLRELGFNAALVAQDGLEHMAIRWESFDALFIGGTTEWKLGSAARELMREALTRGKWVHAGRVNSYRRLRLFADVGAQSADGTFLKFAPDHNLPRLERWFARLHLQPAMRLEAGN